MRCDGVEYVLDVDLWTTRHASVKVWKTQVDEVPDKVKDLLAFGWQSRSFRALVEGVQDKINRALIWTSEHLL